MKEILNLPEYDFLRTDERLGENIVLLGLGGSRSYGTNLPDSDTDVRGIATRLPDDILLGRDYETIVETNTDTTVYSLDKMFTLLAECNPNCIELLGLRPQDYLLITPVGQIILNNKEMFLSKQCMFTFSGYATQQLYRLQQKTLAALTQEEFDAHIAKVITNMKQHLDRTYGISGIEVTADLTGLKVSLKEQSNIPMDVYFDLMNEIGNVVKEYKKNSKRNQKAIEHGKISKHAMHLLRLYMTGTDLLTKKEIITYREADHDLLMKIRNGEYTGDDGLMSKEFFEIVHEYEAKFEEAKKITTLPDKPDYVAIDRIRKNINYEIVSTKFRA